LLFGLLRCGGIADDNREISIVSRRPGIALNAPVEVNARQNDHLDFLARQLEWKLGSDERRLKSKLVELEVARLD
jgi:hypothetical protein